MSAGHALPGREVLAALAPTECFGYCLAPILRSGSIQWSSSTTFSSLSTRGKLVSQLLWLAIDSATYATAVERAASLSRMLPCFDLQPTKVRLASMIP